MVSPSIKQHRIAILRFPVTCLGSISNKPIKFKNISSVKCLVKMEISQPAYDDRPIFWISSVSSNDQNITVPDNKGYLRARTYYYY
jgi:hypothetical protein